MNSLWKRLGLGLLIVALGGAAAACGDDDSDDSPAGSGGGGTGGTGVAGGSGGSGGSRAGGSGGSGGSRAGGSGGAGGSAGATVMCGSAGALPAACISCIQAEVTNCGSECAALLNCSANKCTAAMTQAEQQACVSSCCLDEATTAVSGPGGQDTLRAAQAAQRMACAAMCGAGDADAGM